MWIVSNAVCACDPVLQNILPHQTHAPIYTHTYNSPTF